VVRYQSVAGAGGGGRGQSKGDREHPSTPNSGPEAQPLLLAKVTDVHQQMLGLAKPVALVAEDRPEVRIAGDSIDLPGQLLEELGHFGEPSVDLVGRLAMRAKDVESVLHTYLPG
jgi:hypothetical protein